MVDVLKRTPKLKDWRDRFGKPVEKFMIFLSVAAVLLTVCNEFVPRGFQIPGLSLGWTDVTGFMRAFTWATFAAVFALFSLTSHRKFLEYARKWWMEALICVSWIPFTEGVLITQLHSVFSLQTLAIVGTVAHVARISRWTIQEFESHPLVVVLAAVIGLVTISAAWMMVVEPTTFATFTDTAFSVYMTALTLGGPLSPQSFSGRLSWIIISTLGISVLAVYYGVVRELVHRWLFKESEVNEKLLKEVRKQNELLTQQNEQLRTQNTLLLEVHKAVRARPRPSDARGAGAR